MMKAAFLFPGGGAPSVGAPPPWPPSPPLEAALARRRSRAPPACAPLLPPAFSFPAELRLQLPLLLRGALLTGAGVLPAAVVDDALRPLIGRRVTRARVWAALRAAEDWLADHGYVASRVAIVAWPSRANDNVLTVTTVDAVLAEVRLQALSPAADGSDSHEVDKNTPVRTKPATVARALGVKVGDVFRWDPKNFDRVMQLGVFEFARAELEPVSFNEVAVVVSVRERGTSRIEPGAGINSDGRVYGDLSVLDDNFLGRAQRLRIEWQRRLGMGKAAGGIEFEDPRIGAAIPFAVRVRAFRRANATRSLPGVGDGDNTLVQMDRDRDGLLVDFSWRPARMPRLLLSAGPVLEHIHSHQSLSGPRGDHQLLLMLAARRFASELSSLPRFGHRVAAEYGVGRKFILQNRRPPTVAAGDGDLFFRLIARVSQYFALGSKGSIAVGGSIGTGSQNLPQHEQTPLGGPSSVRGYSLGEIGWASTFATGRIEVRLPLVEPEPEQEAAKEKSESAAKPVPNADGELEISRTVITQDSLKTDKVVEPALGENPESKKFQLPKLPHLAGVLFADVASNDLLGAKCTGASYGIGLRVGGVLTVEYTYSQSGEKPKLRFGMVDRDL